MLSRRDSVAAQFAHRSNQRAKLRPNQVPFTEL